MTGPPIEFIEETDEEEKKWYQKLIGFTKEQNEYLKSVKKTYGMTASGYIRSLLKKDMEGGRTTYEYSKETYTREKITKMIEGKQIMNDTRTEEQKERDQAKVDMRTELQKKLEERRRLVEGV